MRTHITEHGAFGDFQLHRQRHQLRRRLRGDHRGHELERRLRANRDLQLHDAVELRRQLRDVLLDDWSLELSRGPSYELFGRVIDLEPSGTLPAPEGRAPWLTAWQAAGVRLSNVRYRAPEQDGATLPAEAICDDVEVALERDVVEVQ